MPNTNAEDTAPNSICTHKYNQAAPGVPESSPISPNGRPSLVDDARLPADVEDTVAFDVNDHEVDLTHARLKVITSKFATLNVVENLCLRQNLISKIENINNLTTLCELDLYDNQLTKIENLSGLVNLRLLDLSFNRIEIMEGLDTLTQLQRLFLVNNRISKIENLDALKVLEMLELGANRLRKIENISHLNKLRQLYLGQNKITSLNGIENLTALETLSIQSNRLVKLEALDGLTALNDIYVSDNGIERIEGLDNNLALTTLDVAGNRLQNIENILHLQQLEELWIKILLCEYCQQCNGNKIADWRNVEQLSHCPSLKCLYLENNPLQIENLAAYRRKVMLLLPHLQQLDATLCKLPTSAHVRESGGAEPTAAQV